MSAAPLDFCLTGASVPIHLSKAAALGGSLDAQAWRTQTSLKPRSRPPSARPRATSSSSLNELAPHAPPPPLAASHAALPARPPLGAARRHAPASPRRQPSPQAHGRRASIGSCRAEAPRASSRGRERRAPLPGAPPAVAVAPAPVHHFDAAADRLRAESRLRERRAAALAAAEAAAAEALERTGGAARYDADAERLRAESRLRERRAADAAAVAAAAEEAEAGRRGRGVSVDEARERTAARLRAVAAAALAADADGLGGPSASALGGGGGHGGHGGGRIFKAAPLSAEQQAAHAKAAAARVALYAAREAERAARETEDAADVARARARAERAAERADEANRLARQRAEVYAINSLMRAREEALYRAFLDARAADAGGGQHAAAAADGGGADARPPSSPPPTTAANADADNDDDDDGGGDEDDAHDAFGEMKRCRARCAGCGARFESALLLGMHRAIECVSGPDGKGGGGLYGGGHGGGHGDAGAQRDGGGKGERASSRAKRSAPVVGGNAGSPRKQAAATAPLSQTL